MIALCSPFGWGLLAAMGYLACVATAFHTSRRNPWLVQFLFAGLWAVAVVVLCLIASALGSAWHSLAFLGFAVATIAFAYSAALKSISLAMLKTAQHADGMVVFVNIDRAIRAQFEERIGFLQEIDLVEKVPEGYRLSPNGQSATNRIHLARRLFSVETGAFYGDTKRR